MPRAASHPPPSLPPSSQPRVMMATTTTTMTDTATAANYLEIISTHLDLELTIDYPNKLLHGSVTHSLTALADNVVVVKLDTAVLNITSCSLCTSSSSTTTPPPGTPLKFTLAASVPVLGSTLTITFPTPLRRGEKVQVVIQYSTTSECTALGFIDTGKYPFLFSQNQAIHCRSLIPVMDTPAIKASYSATVHSTLPVLMSALRLFPLASDSTEIDDSVSIAYRFHQPEPIPSYLIAIAAGEFVFAPLGDRTGVWIEPSRLVEAKWEFKADTERFLSKAESFTSPYTWGRYDMLILPPSFPYGGMENANMTFMTPSLITGDRSNVSVVAHEIVHSWFGNGIGCASWSHFWLNEGWTTYVERLVATFTPAEREFEYILGAKALNDALRGMRPQYQRLVIPYAVGDDPDDAFSSIPYMKGATFLLYLERLVGGLEVFLPYVKAYVKEFYRTSITTDQWLEHFHRYWSTYPEIVIKLQAVKWDEWLHGEGLNLPEVVEFDTSLADSAYSLSNRWNAARSAPTLDFSANDIAKFNTGQICLFLEELFKWDAFAEREIEKMNEVYGLEKSGNGEIRLRWYALALKASLYKHQAAEWVKTAGRMKYCRPTYSAIAAVDRDLAIKTFVEFGVTFLHPIAKRLIAKDLGVEL